MSSESLFKKLKNYFEKEFTCDLMVQFDEQGKVDICGSHIKWLKPVVVKAVSRKKAEEKALNEANKIYPEYLGYIQIY